MADGYKRYLEIGDEVIPKRTLQRFRHAQDAASAETEQMEINVAEPALVPDIVMVDATLDTMNNSYEEENILINEESHSFGDGCIDEDAMSFSLQETLFNNDDECDIPVPKKKKPKNLQDFIESEEFSSPISTPVNKTLGEIVLMINKFCKNECLSMTGRINLIKLINTIFEEPILPDSRYMVDKILTPQSNVQYHAVCHECTAYIGNFDEVHRSVTTCTFCNAAVNLSNQCNENYFVLIDPSAQISDLLKIHDSYYDSIMRDRECTVRSIKDIHDGNAYRTFVFSLPEQDRHSYATTIFNTDGAPKFKCSKYSIWPIYLILNELPPQERMANVIIYGLWFHKKKPQMTAFLNPFVDFMNTLNDKGISCSIKGEERKIKIFVLLCCVDSVARAPIQGIKQFNGNFGCSWCLHPGVFSDGSMRYPLLSYTPEARQAENTIADMRTATPENPINGIKHPSPLINLQFFDIILGFVPDYMHCCLEGVAYQFMEYYLQSMNFNDRENSEIDLLMRKVTLPHQIARLTRSMSSWKDWKAREWENFVLYVSTPVFSTNLSKKLFNHWLLFAESVYILLKEEIDIVELDRADAMLHEFVAKAGEYFGPKAMTFNVHQMLHLCKSVLDWGPLWAHSTFPFESANFQLLRAIKCARGVTKQIVRFANINHGMIILQEHVYNNASALVKFYCDDVLSVKVQNTLKIGDTTYFGKGSYNISDELISNLNLSLINRKSFVKMVKNGCLYSSSLKLNKRSNNSFAQLVDKTFIQIMYFIVNTDTEEELTVCHSVVTSNAFRNSFITMRKIESIANEFTIVPTSIIDSIGVYVKINDIQYICPVSNSLHY